VLAKFVPTREEMDMVVFVSPLVGAMEVRVGLLVGLLIVKPLDRTAS
jgi:hypothetical protein